MTAKDKIVAVVLTGLVVVGVSTVVDYVFLGLASVARNWRWWLSWFTSERSFSRCPRCTYSPSLIEEDSGWLVCCGHFSEESPTKRMARFHWERHVRAWRR